MYNDHKFIFYEKQYYHELETKEKIDLRLQTVIGFTFAYVSIGSYMVRMLDFESNIIFSFIFCNLMSIAALFVVKSLSYSVPESFGVNYKKLINPIKIENSRINYKKWCEDYAPEKTEEEIKCDLNKGLLDDLNECTSQNFIKNKIRGENCYMAIKWLTLSIAPFALAGIIFIGFKLDLTHPSKPILIEEQSIKGVLYGTEKISTTATATDKTGYGILQR
ncbi:hypothetical protein [Vibrio sp. 10N.247.310.17]|uniref:hypothetical protein n=1 Tax=Vibrio sp. 10N.247.310.17 TaxID=3229979 RepID=UPI0035520BC4